MIDKTLSARKTFVPGGWDVEDYTRRAEAGGASNGLLSRLQQRVSAFLGLAGTGGEDAGKAPPFTPASHATMIAALEHHVARLKIERDTAERSGDPDAPQLAAKVESMETDLIRLQGEVESTT